MSPGLDRPKKILAVADVTDAMIAVKSALNLARTHGASLEIIACVEPPHDLSILSRVSGANSDTLMEHAIKQAHQTLEARLATFIPNGSISLSVVVGKEYLEIIRHVTKSDCDVVVKMAEPLSGFDRFLFASTDQHLLRKCPCPVWLVMGVPSKAPRRILATVDLDIQDAAEPETLAELNRRVIHAACIIGDASECEIIVLHAWDAIGDGMIWAFSNTRDARLSADRYVNEILDARHEEMERLLGHMRKNLGPRVRLIPRMIRGLPEAVIHEQSRIVSAEVVVMGTVARTGISGVLIGNTAENILNSLDCPVLAVKPEGFANPFFGA